MNFKKFVRLKGWLCLTLVLCVFLSGIPLSNQVALAAPATPTGLTAIPFKLKDAPDANHVNLKWNVISNAESYKLFRSDALNGAYTLIYQGIAPEHQDIGLSVGATYYYKVAAADSVSESASSEAVSATTFAVPINLRTWDNTQPNSSTIFVKLKVGAIYYRYQYVHDANGFLEIRAHTSPDGENWTFKQVVLDRNSDPDLASCKLESVNFVYNESTGKIVMIAHYENKFDYSLARIATASGLPGETMTFYDSYRPLGNESRDIGIFKDADGAVYLISTANGNLDTYLYKMSPDYLTVDSLTTIIYTNQRRELPSMVKKDGYYYLFTSGQSGWYPTKGQYSSATSLSGPWSELRNIGNSSTFSAQSGGVEVLKGTDTTSYYIRHFRYQRPSNEPSELRLPLAFNNGYASYEYFEKMLFNPWTGVSVPEQDGKLLSEGKPATAQDQSSTTSAGDVVDGNYFTNWSSATDSWPKWWTVDLGLTYDLSNIQLSWELIKGSEGYYKYKIETSQDGVNYTLALDRTNNTRYGFTTDKLTGKARYVRVQLTGVVVRNATKYYPRIYEVKVFGSVTKTETTAPTAPSNLTATTISGDQINLNWTASTDNTGVAGYRIYRDGVFVGFSSSTSYSDTGLSGNKTYSYTVRAYDASENVSASSNTATETTLVNLALNKAVTYSSQQAGNEASRVVDGNGTTRWSAETYPQWVQVDLSQIYSINRIDLAPYMNRAYQYKIEASTDGVSYSTVVDRTANTTEGPLLTDFFSSTNARYVKLTVTGASNYTGGWVAINELKVYSAPTIVSGGTYKIKHAASGKYLDTDQNGVVWLADATTYGDQDWIVSQDASGYWTIKNAITDRYYLNTDLDNIVTWDTGGGIYDDALWSFEVVSTGGYRIKNKVTGRDYLYGTTLNELKWNTGSTDSSTEWIFEKK